MGTRIPHHSLQRTALVQSVYRGICLSREGMAILTKKRISGESKVPRFFFLEATGYAAGPWVGGEGIELMLAFVT